VVHVLSLEKVDYRFQAHWYSSFMNDQFGKELIIQKVTNPQRPFSLLIGSEGGLGAGSSED